MFLSMFSLKIKPFAAKRMALWNNPDLFYLNIREIKNKYQLYFQFIVSSFGYFTTN